MTQLFVGQVLTVGFPFAPKGLAQCDGQIMPIQQNQALFSLLGTSYGGNGTTVFGLPDLRGRVPVGFGPSADPNWRPANYPIGERGGVEGVTLTTPELPLHAHQCVGTSASGGQGSATNAFYATTAAPIYGAAGTGEVTLSAQSIAPVGGNQAHENMQPFIAINFCIALTGAYPSRS
ncbi:MAG: phage tail protein [Phyllobacterium sp.]